MKNACALSRPPFCQGRFIYDPGSNIKNPRLLKTRGLHLPPRGGANVKAPIRHLREVFCQRLFSFFLFFFLYWYIVFVFFFFFNSTALFCLQALRRQPQVIWATGDLSRLDVMFLPLIFPTIAIVLHSRTSIKTLFIYSFWEFLFFIFDIVEATQFHFTHGVKS